MRNRLANMEREARNEWRRQHAMTPREKAASLLTNAEVDGILDAHNICRECLEPLTVEGDGGDEPQHVFCDICGQAEHPADLTPDWNGETGNHISCEKQQKEVR